MAVRNKVKNNAQLSFSDHQIRFLLESFKEMLFIILDNSFVN